MRIATRIGPRGLSEPAWRNAPPRTRASMIARHVRQRQGDEYACSCGARWPIDEEHP